ncbi:MAG: NAD-dependent epimerase/dehydratase family protein [Myxococcota bacterium]|nr:NAD-dependent epimerase/dehydratase family protein [Myxococcota bacterium]
MSTNTSGAITESEDMIGLLDKVALTPLEQNSPRLVCCVTGATSMVGSHVVRRLLRAGHTVHAPVRSLDENKIGFLKAMPGANDRLKFFKVTGLTDPGSYDESILGCDVVHHVASPFFMVGSKEKLEHKLFGPALGGVENILAACSKAPTVKKVIPTGTCLTVAADYAPSDDDPNWTVTEAEWDTSTAPDDFPYVHSKILQEKRAEEIASQQSQWELITLLIGGTFGPLCFTNGAGINAMFLKYVRMGLFFPACPPVGFPMQDVRDVALMHSLAMSSPKASGRYLVPQRFVRFFEFCDVLRSDRRTKWKLLPLFEMPAFFFFQMAVWRSRSISRTGQVDAPSFLG